MTRKTTSHRPIAKWWLISIAGLAALASLAFAAAPVRQSALEYRYRPGQQASGVVGDSAAASLSLARGSADALHLQMPCDRPGSAFSTSAPPEWLDRAGAITFNDWGNALYVQVDDGAVTATRNGAVVARLDVSDQPGCLADLEYRDGSWTLSAEGHSTATEGGPARVSDAWFTGPAASSAQSMVTIETQELGTSPSGVQIILLVVALVGLLIVSRELILHGLQSTSSDPYDDGSRLRSLVVGVGFVDGAVLVGLLLWAILIPPNLDDGWIAASVRSYPVHGDFSGIFTVDGSVLPFGYWVMWLQHLWFGLGSPPVVMRLPAVILGLGSWVGLRSIGRRLDLPGRGGSVWLLASVFVVGFGAWGITLRAEPVVAALVVASVWLAVRFTEGGRGWVLVAWAAVIALAMSSHPAGILVLAPVVASWKSFRDWLRSEREAIHLFFVWLLIVGSVLVLVWMVDTNIASKLKSIAASRATSSHDSSIAEEFQRYRDLGLAPYATSMRRASVAFIAIGLGAFLLRTRRGVGLRNLPAWSLVAGLFLLTLTPSKWPWHVGGLMGLVALVVAIELRQVERPRWVLAMLGVVFAASWIWSVSLPWTAFDLRTYAWTVFDPLTERARSEVGALPFELSSLVGWAITAAVIALVATAVLRWRHDLNPPRPPEAVAMFVAVLVVMLTASTLWSDATDTAGWTFGGQNFSSLRGDATCGLGDEIAVPVPGSLHTLTAEGLSGPDADAAALAAGFSDRGGFESGGYLPLNLNSIPPLVGMESVGSWTTTAEAVGELNTGRYRSDWFRLDPRDDEVVLFVMGGYRADNQSELGNAVAIQWGAKDAEGIADRGVEAANLSGYIIDWFLVPFTRPPGADRVRLLLRDDTAASRESWVAASLPLAVSIDTIGAVAKSSGAPILVTPPLAPYFPCIRVPEFERSVVPPPGMIIQTWNAFWQETFNGAAAPDRWFEVGVKLEPRLRDAQIGAHTGDTGSFLYVSQKYLSGAGALINGGFTLVGESE